MREGWIVGGIAGLGGLCGAVALIAGLTVREAEEPSEPAPVVALAPSVPVGAGLGGSGMGMGGSGMGGSGMGGSGISVTPPPRPEPRVAARPMESAAGEPESAPVAAPSERSAQETEALRKKVADLERELTHLRDSSARAGEEAARERQATTARLDRMREEAAATEANRQVRLGGYERMESLFARAQENATIGGSDLPAALAQLDQMTRGLQRNAAAYGNEREQGVLQMLSTQLATARQELGNDDLFRLRMTLLDMADTVGAAVRTASAQSSPVANE